MAEKNQPEPRIMTEGEAQQERMKRAVRESEQNKGAKPLTETVPGGHYLLDDGKTAVDANGKPIEKGGED